MHSVGTMTAAACAVVAFSSVARSRAAFSNDVCRIIGRPVRWRSSRLSMSTTLNSCNGRISRGSVSSLDARAVAENLPLVLSHLKARRANSDAFQAAEKIAALNEDRVALILRRDSALSIRKAQSAIVGKLMRDANSSNSTDHSLEEARRLSTNAAQEASDADAKLAQIEDMVGSLLASLPNIIDDVVPDGNDDRDNQEVQRWGDTQTLPSRFHWPQDFSPKWHDDVAAALGGWQAESAVQMSGARFVALSGPVARLERAISTFLMDLHTTSHGYTEVSVPYVVGRKALEGTSQLPKFEQDLFRISSHTCNGQDAFLIPTAEVPLTNLHAGQILDEENLPLSYVALTPCFRAEAGSYGRDTRGLIRTHQFHKVELVKITNAHTSAQEHETLTRHAQACLEALELPYRKVRLCSGDIGFSARHCYDLEVWLPGQGEYREVSSCSNTGDFQSRRLALRYRPSNKADDDNDGEKKKKRNKAKPRLCHTINGSGLAIGRTLVAILENYQMPDGSLVVPNVLRPYMGNLKILNPN